ncbi:MAG: hypothetical protein V9G12_11290 [Microthrixaceae bacterium]
MGKFIKNNIWLIVISGGVVLLAVFQVNTSYRIAQLERKAEELAHATLESMAVQPAGGQQETNQTEAATPIPPAPLDTSAEVTAQPEVYLILNYREYFWYRLMELSRACLLQRSKLKATGLLLNTIIIKVY